MPKRKRGFYAGANPLNLFDTAQGDANLLSGFTKDASVTATVNGAEQTVATDTKDDGVESEAILFPFEGQQLIASADFSGATVRFNIGIRFLDASMTVISESISDYIASGRRSQSATVPANTVYVQWISTRNEASAADGGAWTFTRPALRTNSSTYSE